MLVTANGKEVQVIPNGKGAYKIQFATGGELPEYLSGLYTSSRQAAIAAKSYVETTKEKTKKTKEE
jgi:hypothetical protein